MTRINKDDPGYRLVAADLAERFGAEPKPRDVWWGLLNHRLKAASSVGRPTDGISYEMAVMLAEDHRPSFPIMSRLKKADLAAMKKAGDTLVEIHAVVDDQTCDACAEQDGKRMSTEDAIRLQPIPHPKCSGWGTDGGDDQPGLCRCTYVAVTPEDE